MSVLKMELGPHSYPIMVERGALAGAGELFSLKRRVLILSDSGVPSAYVQAVAAACAEPHPVILAPGEENKCPERLFAILQIMLDAGFTREDALVAVGGGVIGDLGGLVAAMYMRGIDFYNMPTTLLSQVDSSVGGKVAIDFGGYKNTVGTFYQPRAVLIDPEVLHTLDARQYGCGMAEIIKMFATSDGAMFARLEEALADVSVEEMVVAALRIKMQVVAADEREGGLRRVLNFGHTVGHAVESISASDHYPLLHGECVWIGMLAMTQGEVRRRLAHLLHRLDLPTAFRCREGLFRSALLHDKKGSAGGITTVRVPEIGSFTLQHESVDAIVESSREVISFI